MQVYSDVSRGSTRSSSCAPENRVLSTTPRAVPRLVASGIRKRVNRQNAQEVCPWNGPKLVEITKERDYRAGWRKAADRPEVPGNLPGTESPSLVQLMRMTHEEWDVWTRGSARRRAGYAGFKRNVAVAMGNWLASVHEPPEEAMAVLREAVDDEEPLVREPAAWALAIVTCGSIETS